MKKYELMNLWVSRILRYVKSKRGYQHQMCQSGHLSPHAFSHESPVFGISLGRAIWIVVNYAQICKNTEKQQEFKDDWNKLGDAIMLLVDNGLVDRLNNLFDPKKS